MIEQLQQLCRVTWDGNLISKNYRGDLVRAGYAARMDGYNFITPKGIKLLVSLNLLPKECRP